MTVTRQQVLQLYMSDSAFDSNVVAWAFHDGTDGQGSGLPDRGDKPPYITGVDALRDGWNLLQMSQLLPPTPGREHRVSYLPYEFLLERCVEVENAVEPNESDVRHIA
jgi:hypothetical protein